MFIITNDIAFTIRQFRSLMRVHDNKIKNMQLILNTDNYYNYVIRPFHNN